MSAPETKPAAFPAPAPATPASAAISRLEAATIAAMEPVTPQAALLRVTARPPALFEAHKVPGMQIVLKLPGGEAESVALCSKPGARAFETLVEKGTPLASALVRCKEGQACEISAPFGTGFLVDEHKGKDVYLVGFGAGAGPVRAALLHILPRRKDFGKVRVLLEGRFLDDIPFRDEIPAWQEQDVRVYQILARPDMGKWKRGEGAYLHDELRDMEPDPKTSVFFASGPADMLQGVQGVLRALRVPPTQVFLFERMSGGRERAVEADRPKALLDKITPEGIFGSGHQKDAPDHAPGFRTPAEQPRGEGLAPYQRGKKAGAGHH